MTYNMAEKQLA